MKPSLILRFSVTAVLALCAAAAIATPASSYVSVSSGNATIVDLGDQFAVVFSNAQALATLTALQDCYLLRSLVVGGGGGGGKTMGGGGGGGQVVERSGVVAFSAGDTFTVTVGAGGALGTASGYPAGLQGGTSTLVYPNGTTINAYGGGGGGGFTQTEPTASANGQIGSGGGNGYNRSTVPTKGTHYNYGNPGGLAQGGGGGAGTPGEDAGLHVESVLYGNETAYRAQAGYGGEGVTNDISGVNEVYGSGGGGGGGQNYWSQFHAPGGTHAGAGATRTDKTGGGDGNHDALPADEGFGSGGGGGSFSQTGSGGVGNATKGGCGTVILRFTKVDMSAIVFEIAPIVDEFYYTGSAIEPVPVVTHVKDGSTVDPSEYDVEYLNNIQPGTATVRVVGKGGHAGLAESTTFTILNMVADAYIAASDFTMRALTVANRHVYVFTNTASAITLTARQDLTLVDALVVGGGGSGGQTVGGGGGGGGVTPLENTLGVMSGDTLTLNVGAGAIYNMGSGSYPSGTQGGTSTLSFPNGLSLVAYGGGGGGGYQKSPTTASGGAIASGGGAGGGGNYSAGSDGSSYNSSYGNSGSASGGYDYAGGGGGAAAAASGTAGGEGVTNGITGVNVVYGSGGGAGTRNSTIPGAGGTNAGSGTNGTSTVHAPDGVDGTGSGGGGGGYTTSGGFNCWGGNGGAGTIILAFEEGVVVGQPTIESLSVAYPNGITQPKVSATFGNANPGGLYSATVTMALYSADGALLETNTYFGVSDGDSVEWGVPLCLQPSTEIYAVVSVTSVGATDVQRRVDSTATGSVSPYYGRGGGAGVIHVRPGATGKGDGSDWFNACTDFRAALADISSAQAEVWFAGDETLVYEPEVLSPAVPAVIRGGFAGTEMAASERAAGALSTIDAQNNVDCFAFANAQSVTLDGFLLRRGKTHNLAKSGTGDLVVTNCTVCDVSSGLGAGRGVYLNNAASATVTLVEVRFFNLLGSGNGAANGTALYAESLRRVFIDGCLFSTNGCPFDATGNTMHNHDGACIYADGAPLTVRRTRFAGNRSQALTYGGDHGGVVRIRGNCGETAFTNCTFVGNEVVHGYGNYTIPSSENGMFAVSPSAGTVDIVGCTFAMGLAEVNSGAAGVSVISGTASISDCIFHGNTNGTSNTAGSDIHVSAGATANVSYCLFDDDSATRVVCADGGTLNLNAPTCVYGDPLFVTDTEIGSFVRTHGVGIDLNSAKLGELAMFNVHLRGGKGYYDEKTGALVDAFAGKPHSPAIDAGNPERPHSAEPDNAIGSHGHRVNLGAYGGTPWATMSTRVGFYMYLR